MSIVQSVDNEGALRVHTHADYEYSTLAPSVITSKPAISYHFKTGQRSHTQDQMMFYRAGQHSGKCLLK